MRVWLLAIFASACTGGGPDAADGGPADFVSATIDGSARQFAARAFGQRFAGQASVQVHGYAAADGGEFPQISLAFPGSVGAHACDAPFDAGEVSVGLTEDPETGFTATNVQTGRTCAIDVTRLDADGGRWAGTFSATLQDPHGDVRALSGGRFDVPAP